MVLKTTLVFRTTESELCELISITFKTGFNQWSRAAGNCLLEHISVAE